MTTTARSVRRTALSACLLAAVSSLAACTAPVTEATGHSSDAVVNGAPDGNAHPSTGALVALRQGVVVPRCTGALISPTILVTAAHCGVITTDGRVNVTFENPFVVGVSRTYSGAFIPHPGFDQKQDDPHDLAVVRFDAPIANIAPAKLPKAGSLSALSLGAAITTVGYGIQSIEEGSRTPTQDQGRWSAVGPLNAVNPAWLRVSMNAGKDLGGACYGDSGGPNFLGDSNVIAGTTIGGDTFCNATNVVYRLDTASARAFLAGYVALP